VRDARGLAREVERILETYREPALVEDYLPGREFTVGVLGNGGDVRVLPIVEIRFDALPQRVNPIYSYEAKWIWDRAENPLEIFDCPAKVADGLRHEIEKTSKEAYRILNCRDWSRIDLRLDAHGTGRQFMSPQSRAGCGDVLQRADQHCPRHRVGAVRRSRADN
jgi:D-alanine-D-alanine ligase